jgi:hypothetical protein
VPALEKKNPVEIADRRVMSFFMEALAHVEYMDTLLRNSQISSVGYEVANHVVSEGLRKLADKIDGKAEVDLSAESIRTPK